MDTENNKVSDSENATADGIHDDDRLVDLKRVAALLGVCGRTVHRLIAAGELRPPVKVGRASRWFVSDVEGYMSKLKQQRDAKYHLGEKGVAA